MPYKDYLKWVTYKNLRKTMIIGTSTSYFSEAKTQHTPHAGEEFSGDEGEYS